MSAASVTDAAKKDTVSARSDPGQWPTRRPSGKAFIPRARGSPPAFQFTYGQSYLSLQKTGTCIVLVSNDNDENDDDNNDKDNDSIHTCI